MIDRREPTQWEHSIPGIIALLLTGIVGGVAMAVLFVVIPEKNQTLVTQVTTALFGGWMLMLGYYFGSTQTQGRKDATIQTLASTAQAAGAALAPTVPSIPVAPGEVLTVKGEGGPDGMAGS